MLLDLRETIRNSKPLKYSLIGLICVPFALVGVGSYFAGGSAQPAALVNGEPIDEQALETAYRQQRQRFAQMFGGEIPPGFDDEALLRQQALDQLVTQQVLAEEVAAQRFAIGDTTLGRTIRQRPEFQTDGQFDPERYRQLLGGSRANQVAAFEAQARNEAAMNQFSAGVVGTAFRLPSEAARLDELARQQRTIDAVRFDLAAAKADVEIEDEAIVERFDQNADSYTFPPRAKVAWLELSAQVLADTIDVSEDDARDWYEVNRTTFMTPASRDASHILFTVEDAGDADAIAEATEQAQQARARLEAGESFAELAGELSDDPGSASTGGSLGTIAPGLMVPAFENALGELATVDEVSQPVVTEFGVHLIKLDALVPESGRGFDEVRDEALANAASDAADREYFEVREQLAELAFDNPESLEVAADATGLPIQTSDWVDRDSLPEDIGDVLANPQVMTAVFSEDVLQDGNNSELIELGERRVVVVRVTDDEGPRPKTLDDMRDVLRDEIATERAGELLDQKASAARGSLDAGESADTLADADPLATALAGETLQRRSSAFDPATVGALFAAPVPDGDEPVSGVQTLAGGDRLAWRLIDVSTPARSEPDDAPAANAPPSGVTAGADPRLGTVEFGALLDSLRARADIDLQP